MNNLLWVCLLLWVGNTTADQQSASKDLEAVQKKIDAQKKAIQAADSKSKNILANLQEIDQKSEVLSRAANKARKAVQVKQKAVEVTQSEITQIQDKLAEQKTFMQAHMGHLYKHGSINVLQTWFQKMETNDRRRHNVWISHWVAKERDQVEHYQQNVAALGQKQMRLTQQKRQQEELLREVKINAAHVAAEKSKKQTLLASVRNQKQMYQQSLQELEAASQKIQKLLDAIEDAPSVDTGAFERARGSLKAPVHGSITRSYGPYQDKTLKAKVYHKGIDYQAKKGDAVKSVFQGKVVYAGWFEGYGKVVIVDHGSHYFSLYAHLSQIEVVTQQYVRQGSVIGQVGDTGSLKGALLYFELRQKGVTVNPMAWFG